MQLFKLLELGEYLDLVKSAKRVVGAYVETKHPTWSPPLPLLSLYQCLQYHICRYISASIVSSSMRTNGLDDLYNDGRSRVSHRHDSFKLKALHGKSMTQLYVEVGDWHTESLPCRLRTPQADPWKHFVPQRRHCAVTGPPVQGLWRQAELEAVAAPAGMLGRLTRALVSSCSHCDAILRSLVTAKLTCSQIFMETFEINNAKEMNRLTDLPVVQLMDDVNVRPGFCGETCCMLFTQQQVTDDSPCLIWPSVIV